MLGPEQLNLGPRPIPQVFTSQPSLQISNDAYRGLSLSASQVVTGVIALEHGRLYLRANSGGEPIRLPIQYLRWLGREVRFQTSPTSSQTVSLVPVSSSPTSASTSNTSDLRGIDILRHLLTGGGATLSPRQSPSAPLQNFADLSAGSLLKDPTLNLSQLLAFNGYKQVQAQKGTDVARSSLLGELLKMLRKQMDSTQRALIVELVEELRARFVKAESAQRQDFFYVELLALLDEVPVDLSFFRERNEKPGEQGSWTVNLSVSFDRNTEVCIQLRLSRSRELLIDFWFPQKELFQLASDNQNLLTSELRGYGLDKVKINLIDDSEHREGQQHDTRLDVSI